MKKLLSIMIVISLSVGIIGCSKKVEQPQKNPYADVISQIYELEAAYYGEGGNTGAFRFENLISSEMITKQEPDIQTDTTIQIGEYSYNLKYKETRFYPVGDRQEYVYSVEGHEEGQINLREDGSVCYALVPIIKLDIDPHDSPEEVWEVLVPALSDLIDLSGFEKDTVHSSGTADEDGFGYYAWLFYSRSEGYLTNSGAVRVSEDGVVNLLHNQSDYSRYEDVCAKIDKEVEQRIIVEKLKSIYNTETTALSEYKLLNDSWWDQELTCYNGEPCIEYTLRCDVYFEEKGTTDAFHCSLLIPVRLLYGSETKATA